MIGYRYNTEQEAIAARQLGADHRGYPKGDTLYWFDYDYSSVDKFWYIKHLAGIEVVLGEPTEFTVDPRTAIKVIEIPSDKVSLLSNYHLYNVDGKYYIDANTAMSIGIVGTVVEIIVEL